LNPGGGRDLDGRIASAAHANRHGGDIHFVDSSGAGLRRGKVHLVWARSIGFPVSAIVRQGESP
jgi:hypothetical protein